MLNFLVFLNQDFGGSGGREDDDATRSYWRLAALFCVLTLTAGVYAVAHLWLNILQ